jgi:hypothetical protein
MKLAQTSKINNNFELEENILMSLFGLPSFDFDTSYISCLPKGLLHHQVKVPI